MAKRSGPTVKQLRAECKALGLKRYSRLRKAELVDLLEVARLGESRTRSVGEGVDTPSRQP